MKAECPNCHLVFDQKRNPHGAAYALEQDRLTKKQEQLLAWWLSNHRTDVLTKEQIVAEFKYVDMDAINARISELKAWDLVSGHDGEYHLNSDLVALILNRGGKLR